MKQIISIIVLVLTFSNSNTFAQSNKENSKVNDEKIPSVFLNNLTWTEIDSFIKNGGTTVIIPTGGTEQNGPHVTLGKHNVRMRLMAEKIALALGDALVAPTMAYVPEGNIEKGEGWMKYPGTISLPEEYFIKVVEYACRSMKKAGFLDILLIGDSFENQNGMKIVSKTLNKEWKDTNVRVHYISDYYAIYQQTTKTLLAEGNSPDVIGIHSGVVDVSYSLAIDPNLVRKDKLSSYKGWSKKQKLKMGFTGDPSKANIELGERMVNQTLKNSLSQIAKLKIENRK